VRRVQIACAAMLLACAGFVALFASAAGSYPGGTHWDHTTVGHDFWRNCLCDVARGQALNGASNARGGVLAQLGMASLALALLPMFWLLPRFFAAARPRLGAVVRAFGAVAVPAALVVVLLPTDRFSQVHGVAIVVAGVPGLLAVLLSVYGLACDRGAPRVVLATGAAALGVAALDFALYVREVVTDCPALVAISVLERLATLLLLAWIGAVAWYAPRVARRSAEPRPYSSSSS